jgi:multidrug transporter EmrE-like cation transporter
MVTALVVVAALSFSVSGYFMKLSSGLTVLGPTALVFALVALGASSQTLAMKGEQMSVIYIVVLGLEALTAFLLGTVLLNESSSLAKVAGVGLVLAGIVLLRFGEP